MILKNLVPKLSKGLANEQFSLFAGAGLSISAGMPSWKELLKPIASDIGLNIEEENDLPTLAQFYVNECGNSRGPLNEHICSMLSGVIKPTYLHQLLAELPFFSYWTTNFDKLIENALIDARKHPQVIVYQDQLSTAKQDSKAKVYKMHGDVDFPDSIIIARDDYDSYQTAKKIFLNILQTELLSKTFLFLGFSFTDPNFRDVLSQLKDALEDKTRTHYWIELIPVKDDSESPEQFLYRKKRLEHHINDLERFNIKCIYVENTENLIEFIESIRKEFQNLKLESSIQAHNYANVRSFEGISNRENLIALTAPTDGIFYESNVNISTTKIAVGDFIEKDQEICVMELHRCFYAIRSPTAGFVDAIMPTEGSKIKKGQILLSMDTSPKSNTGRLFYQNFHLGGVFYRANNPDGPPFVEEGQHVEKGEVLALIEKMKMFFNIVADVSGTIVTILIDNGTEIESLRTLFIIEADDKTPLVHTKENIKICRSESDGYFLGAYKDDAYKWKYLNCTYGKYLPKGALVGEIDLRPQGYLAKKREKSEPISINTLSACLFINFLIGFDEKVAPGMPLYSYIEVHNVGGSFLVQTAPIEGTLELNIEPNQIIKKKEVFGTIKQNELVVPIQSEHGGRVIEIITLSGKYVAKGMVIFKLSSEE